MSTKYREDDSPQTPQTSHRVRYELEAELAATQRDSWLSYSSAPRTTPRLPSDLVRKFGQNILEREPHSWLEHIPSLILAGLVL